MTAHPDDPSDQVFGRHVARAVRELPDAPEALQRSAIALFPAASALGALKSLAQAVVTQVSAVLAFDSWAAPAMAAGMRSGRSATRHLLFSAQGRDIDLRIAPEAGAFALAGQILGPDETGRVELVADADAGAPARVVPLDALGEFRIEGLPRGSYRLTLQLGSERVVLPPLELGEPAA